MNSLNRRECDMKHFIIEKVDESDCMWHLHQKKMYRVYTVLNDGYDDDYDYIDDEEVIKYLDKFFDNK